MISRWFFLVFLRSWSSCSLLTGQPLNLVVHSSLISLFSVFYTVSYSVGLRVIRVGGVWCCDSHFTTGSSCSPHAGYTLNLVVYSPVSYLFYTVLHCVMQHESWEFYRLEETCVVIHTNTSPPFMTLVKLFPLWGNLVSRHTLRTYCSCFTLLYALVI